MTTATEQAGFTPAAGTGALARYDAGVREYTREADWRPLMVKRIDPRPGQLIVDLGAGTGTLAVMLKSHCSGARIVALDPDPDALVLAQAKAAAANVEIEWRQGFAALEDYPAGSVDHVVCSLVLHQVPMAEKRRLLSMMSAWIGARGTIHIADYGRQRGTMRARFRATVQAGDGIEDTQPNADGALERLLHDLDLRKVARDRHFVTRSGKFSLFSRKA